MSEAARAFSRVIKQERKARGVPMQAVAKALGISQQSIVFYEAGSRVPNIEIARKFAEYFGVSADYLLGMSYYRTTKEMEVTCERIASCE